MEVAAFWEMLFDRQAEGVREPQLNSITLTKGTISKQKAIKLYKLRK